MRYLFYLLAGLLLARPAPAQTTDDPRALRGTWLYRVGFGANISTAATGVLTPAQLRAQFPFVRGVLNPVRWAQLEPQPDRYAWAAFDQSLNAWAAAGLDLNLMIWAGPDCPQWLYRPPYGVDSVLTVGGSNTNWTKFPNYRHPQYALRWYRMLDSVAAHVRRLPAATRARIVLYQSAEGTTGDETPYKGAAINPAFALTSTDPWWISFRHDAWQHLATAYASFTPPVHVMINGLDDAPELAWIGSHAPLLWRKANNMGHYWQMNTDRTMKQTYDTLVNRTAPADTLTVVRCRDEYDTHQSPVYLQAPAWYGYWTALHALHFGVDLWSANPDLTVAPVSQLPFAVFDRYAGHKNPRYCPGAFCALRDGLDAADTLRFPSATYGRGTATNNAAGRARAVAIANGQPQRSRGSRQLAPADGQAGPVNNTQAAAINDVGWDILDGNYARYLTQYAPNATSVGYWRVGPLTQPYGRFARGLDPATGRDTMSFDLHDNFWPAFPNAGRHAVSLRVVYYDTARAQWELRYDALSGPHKLAFAHTNRATHRWQDTTVTITDGYFGNRAGHGTDLQLVYKGGTGAIFHLVEVLKVASPLATAVAAVPAPAALTLYPNPAATVLHLALPVADRGPVVVCILDVLGRVVWQQQLAAPAALEVPVAGLPGGLYLVRVQAGGRILTARFSK